MTWHRIADEPPPTDGTEIVLAKLWKNKACEMRMDTFGPRSGSVDLGYWTHWCLPPGAEEQSVWQQVASVLKITPQQCEETFRRLRTINALPLAQMRRDAVATSQGKRGIGGLKLARHLLALLDAVEGKAGEGGT